MNKKEIKFTTSQYEYSYHSTMLIGDYNGQIFITNFYNYSIITPISLRWAKTKLIWRFKAMFN